LPVWRRSSPRSQSSGKTERVVVIVELCLGATLESGRYAQLDVVTPFGRLRTSRTPMEIKLTLRPLEPLTGNFGFEDSLIAA
jgi:hypothetical protein